MATEQELVGALQKADAAGDHEGAQQIADMIKAQRAGTDPAAPQAPPPSAADQSHAAAAQAGLQAGADENPLLAGVSQAAQQATFGGQNYINAGVRWAAQRAAGVKNPDSFADNLEYSRSKSAGEAASHPIASTIGGTVGSFLGGGAIGDAVKVAGKVVPGVARVAGALTPKAGQAVTNVAKSAGINGLIGIGSSEAAGDDHLTSLRNGAVSAVAGPVLSKGANLAFQKMTPVAQRAMMVLAKTLDEHPTTLAAANQAYTHLTGTQAPLAALTNLKSQGKLKALAAANDEIGQVAATAADQGGAPLHQQLSDLQAAQQNPQTVEGRSALRDQNHTDALNAVPPTSNLPLRDAPVRITTQNRMDTLTDPLIDHALRPDTRVSNSLFGPDDLHNAIATDTLTVGDLDHIRLQLRNQQAVHDSPTAGTARNPEVAKAYGNAAQAVEAMATSAHPAYGQAMQQYRAASDYTDGFQHAFDGKPLVEMPDINKIQARSNGPTRVANISAGYAHGQALRKGQQALAAIAPGTVAPPPEMGAATGAKVLHAVAAPSVLSVAGIMNHLSGTALPKQAQHVVADMLYSTDPTRNAQAIANLEKAGVQSDDLRRLAGVIGGVVANRITAHLDNRDQ